MVAYFWRTVQQYFEHCRFEATTKIRLRFIVGSHADPELQATLEEEATAHEDFHVLAVQETYDNLVLKVLIDSVVKRCNILIHLTPCKAHAALHHI